MRDVELSYDAGADAFGMIFAPSQRRITFEAAEQIARSAPPGITPVGVFVDPSASEVARFREVFPNALVQLCGNESPAFVRELGDGVIKAVHVGAGDAAAVAASFLRFAPALVLLDTKRAGAYGGTGETFPWEIVAAPARWHPVLIAGGLTPENVGACVRAIRPFGVDVRSGIESGGRKDVEKMQRFVRAVRENDVT